VEEFNKKVKEYILKYATSKAEKEESPLREP
jgi:hypothetical protein